MAGHAPSALPHATSGLLYISLTHSEPGQLHYEVLSYVEHQPAFLYCDCSVFPMTRKKASWILHEVLKWRLLSCAFWMFSGLNHPFPPSFLLRLSVSSSYDLGGYLWTYSLWLGLSPEPKLALQVGERFLPEFVGVINPSIHRALGFSYFTYLYLTFLIHQRRIKIVLASQGCLRVKAIMYVKHLTND